MKYRNYNRRRIASSTKPFLSRRLERKSKRNLFVTLFISAILLYVTFVWFIPTFIGSLSLLNQFKPQSQSSISVAEKASLAPPVLNIPFESTNTATIKVHGYALSNTSVEIYNDNNLKTTVKTNEDGSFTSDPIDLNLGTNNISGKTADDSGNKSLTSKPINIYYTNEKPSLEISEPEDNKTIKGGDKKVNVSGKTSSDRDISLTINGVRTIVQSDGSFSRSVDINEGDNNITISATDNAGNNIQSTRKVTYQP